MNHYPRHVGDIISATIGLTLMERGAYTALLDQYYAREKPLPADKREVYRLAAAATSAERKAVDYVLGRYFTLEPDGYHQKRADREIQAYQNRADTARQNGRNGGRPPNQEKTQSVISGNPEKSGSKANQEPVTSNQEPEPKKAEAKPKARAGAAAPLPPWIDPADWERWRKHRGSKLTPQAQELQLAKLDGMRAHYPPGLLIRLAIESGWATFYPPKAQAPPRVLTLAEKRAATAAAMYGHRVGGKDDAIDGTAERVA